MKTPFAFLFLVLFSISNQLLSQKKKTESFINDYLEVAFWKPQDIKQPLMKWVNKDTIRYKFVGDLKFMNEKELNKYLLELENLIKISFQQTIEDEYDILIFFGSIKSYSEFLDLSLPEEVFDRFNNWSHRRAHPNGNLIMASGCIDINKVNDKDLGKYYLRTIFLKSLGLLGQIDDEYSIFHIKYNNNFNLSKSDKRLVKMHYHDQIQSGTNTSEVKKILNSIENIDLIAVEKLR